MNLPLNRPAHRFPGRRWWPAICFGLCLCGSGAWAQTNSTAGVPAPANALPEVGSSLLRVFGALVLVTAIFLGGVWLFRNWQRFVLRKGEAPRLSVIEVKSLGQRHAIYVIGYEQQRMLLASSPGGVSLLSHLPAAEELPASEPLNIARPSFAEAFRQVLSRKP